MPRTASVTPPVTDERRRRGARRFARVGRVLPVALLQVVGTLLVARFPAGPSAGARGGPPWLLQHGDGAPAIDAAHPGSLAVVLLVAGVVVLPWRWRWPTAVLVATLATTVGYALLVSPRGPFVAALTMAAVNAWIRGRRVAVVVAVTIAAAVLPSADVLVGRSAGWDVDAIVLAVAWAAVTLSVAELVRIRLERVAERRRRQAEAEQERARDERVRIARELHDSVAHSMSLINLQAGVALHLGTDLPEPTRQSLADIRDTSRDALVELRTILGVLRSADGRGDPDGRGGPDGRIDPDRAGAAADQRPSTGVAGVAPTAGRPTADDPDRSPVPGLDRLPDLVDRARAAGLDLSARIDGDPAALARATDGAAFRIVQESVTNVMKHAPDHATAIEVRIGPDVVDLLVEDAPSADRAGSAGSVAPLLGTSGNGIIGMRERANAVGGTLVVGPTPTGGWRVTARLPVGGRGPTGDDASTTTVKTTTTTNATRATTTSATKGTEVQP